MLLPTGSFCRQALSRSPSQSDSRPVAAFYYEGASKRLPDVLSRLDSVRNNGHEEENVLCASACAALTSRSASTSVNGQNYTRRAFVAAPFLCRSGGDDNATLYWTELPLSASLNNTNTVELSSARHRSTDEWKHQNETPATSTRKRITAKKIDCSYFTIG